MRLNSSKKFLESTTVQVLTITLCVFAIVALLLRLRLHQTMLSVVTTSYASIDETRAHIEGQIWLPDLRQRDVENYCAGFVYTDESKTTLDHISARYELQGGCVLRFLADYDRTIDLIIDDSNDLQFLECDNRCIYYRQDSSSRTDFYFAYFSENDIYYELMLSVPIGTLSYYQAMLVVDYLVEQHGLDAVLEAFFEDEDFPESFGLTYQEALYAAETSFS